MAHIVDMSGGLHCRKCPVSATLTRKGGLSFDGAGCVDLAGSEWGKMGEFEYCPTMGALLHPNLVTTGYTHRDDILAKVAQEREAAEKRKDGHDPQTP
jgi:hypothetical protein